MRKIRVFNLNPVDRSAYVRVGDVWIEIEGQSITALSISENTFEVNFGLAFYSQVYIPPYQRNLVIHGENYTVY